MGGLLIVIPVVFVGRFWTRPAPRMTLSAPALATAFVLFGSLYACPSRVRRYAREAAGAGVRRSESGMTLTGRILRRTLPKPAADRLIFTANAYRSYRNLRRDFAALRRQYAALGSRDEQIGLICSHKAFGAIQQHSEIAGLLKVLEQSPPRYVCEIGTASGGTLFLLAQVCAPDARLLSVDLGLSFERCLVHGRFATRKQRIVSIRGDSRAPATLERVRSLLRGHPLDLLFIDGDHSYEAVKADFALYSPLVRPGGLVVFHDIVPDFTTRYGMPTDHYSGGVPIFWEEIKAQHRTSELIEDPEQDGYGIGVVYN